MDLLRLDMRRWQETIALGWQSGSDPRAPVLAQVAVADRWATLEPAAALPLAWRARARGEMARFLAYREMDPADWATRAKADASEALHRDPNEVEAWVAQASVLRTEGFQLLDQGKDPAPRLQEALAMADQGLRLDPGHVVLLNIRNSALLPWIDAARMRGTYDRAAAEPYLREARALAASHPEEAYYQSNLGGLAQAMAKAELASGGDPSADAEEAVHAYEAGLRTQPGHAGFHRGILIALDVLARAMVQAGKDPAVIVERARGAFQRARDAQAPLATLAPYFMDVLVSAASQASTQGQDPGAYLKEAGRLPFSDGRSTEYPVEFGAIRLRYLALLLRSGPPAQSLRLREAGEAIASSLLRRKPVDPGFWMTLAGFKAACGDLVAAGQARARCRALNPRWRGY